jgi:hypothetical protein
MESLVQRNSLLDYAATYWGHHVRGEGQVTTKEMVLQFLQKKPNVMCAIQVLTHAHYWQWGASPGDGFSEMHVLSFFGLDKVIDCQLRIGAEADIRDVYGRSPLSLAAKNGYDAVVRPLLTSLILMAGVEP